MDEIERANHKRLIDEKMKSFLDSGGHIEKCPFAAVGNPCDIRFMKIPKKEPTPF